MVLRLSIMLGMFAFSAALAWAQDSAPPKHLQKDLREFSDLLEGRWDNDRHVFFAEDAGMDTSGIAARQHLVVRPDGEDAFIATRSVAGEEPVRLRHELRLSDSGTGILQMSSPAPESGFEVAEPCQIEWRRTAGGFEGEADAALCGWMFGPSPDGRPAARLGLSENEFWIETSTTEARFRRARVFKCWAAVARGAEYGDAATDADWYFTRDVTLHDQYGEAILTTDETPPREVGLRLRNVDWPYGQNRPSLTLYIHGDETDRATSYAWAEYDADRIGINLRWMQASCTHEPDALFEEF